MSFMVYGEQFWEKLVKITLSFKIIHNVMKFKHILKLVAKIMEPFGKTLFLKFDRS